MSVAYLTRDVAQKQQEHDNDPGAILAMCAMDGSRQVVIVQHDLQRNGYPVLALYATSHEALHRALESVHISQNVQNNMNNLDIWTVWY